jgi:hypothetical protein
MTVGSVLRGPGRSPDRAARGYPITPGTEGKHTFKLAAASSCRPPRPDLPSLDKEPP